MTDTQPRVFDFDRALRVVVIAAGVVALAAGIIMLVWPVKSAVAITALVAAYAALAGIVDIVLAVISKGLGPWRRVALALLGVLFVVASVVAFANLQTTTALLAIAVVVMLGVTWILDGVVALFALNGPAGPEGPVARPRGWTIAFAVLSILAGIVVVVSPLVSLVWLWLFIAVSLVVFGIVQIVRGVRLPR